MTEERLHQIMQTRRSIREVFYGYHPGLSEPFKLNGEEIEEMARELLEHRQRGQRVAAAAIEGDPKAAYREYARQWMRHDTGE